MPEASLPAAALPNLPFSVEVAVQNAFWENQPASPVFASHQIEPEVWESWFTQWLVALKPCLSPINAYELSVRLTDDAEVQQLNNQYRHKNQPTDVLAFAALEVDYPQLEEALDTPLYLGDLVISVETAQRQAQERGHGLTQELAWLGSHGLLHLLGWDHPNEASLQEMLRQQQDLLQTVGLSVEYD